VRPTSKSAAVAGLLQARSDAGIAVADPRMAANGLRAHPAQ
jgi:hypothetical protein